MIVVNQVHCHKCDDKPFSAHGHDYRPCKCGNIAVDGGMNYLRRVGNGITDRSYTDLSYSLPDTLIEKMRSTIASHFGNDKSAETFATEVSDNLLEVIAAAHRLGNEDGTIGHDAIPRDAHQSCVNAVQWGLDTNRNSLGIALALTRALREHNLLIVGEDE